MLLKNYGRIKNDSIKLEIIIVATHVLSVGILKWLDLSRWQYGLMPISLIGFIIVMIGIILEQHKFINF